MVLLFTVMFPFDKIVGKVYTVKCKNVWTFLHKQEELAQEVELARKMGRFFFNYQESPLQKRHSLTPSKNNKLQRQFFLILRTALRSYLLVTN